MGNWYARPVLFVSDIERARSFYVERMAFTEAWRHEDDGQPIVLQVERSGFDLILSSQWPDKVGTGLIFISLEAKDFASLVTSLEAKGVEMKEGWWGYPILIVEDPDGNQLYFPRSRQ